MQITILKSHVSTYERRDMEVNKITLLIDSWRRAFDVPFTGFKIIKLRKQEGFIQVQAIRRPTILCHVDGVFSWHCTQEISH
jgi:hypothetical protein